MPPDSDARPGLMIEARCRIERLKLPQILRPYNSRSRSCWGPSRFPAVILLLLCLALPLSAGGDNPPAAVCADCIRQNLDYLAGPALHGRGSGTVDEYHAAEYIAKKLKEYGLAPAAEHREYIQTGGIQSRTVRGVPVLSFGGSGARSEPVVLTQGRELAVVTASQPEVSAPLQKLDLNDAGSSPASARAGAAVLLKLKSGSSPQRAQSVVGPYLTSKATLVMVAEPADGGAIFQQLVKRGPREERKVADTPARPDLIFVAHEAAQQVWGAADGTPIRFHADVTAWQISHTWNVLAKIEGTTEKRQVILLSAHLDHLGVRDGQTYPGADDDASGTVAVMELARALAKQRRPQRTVVFALWGSEEVGLVGARYFLAHPTFALRDIVANLEFEMIGRSDPRVKPDELWLTGWERTNLGPELAAHGAKLVGDPHPEQNFFMRSDNFALARDGIVAQTVSSYGLHSDYHQPTDTPDKVDWEHLDSAIGSMIAPVSWLANSDFMPMWNAGGKP
ncbi:MAG TPA: M20/M25/M40 family metallo-hydrolase [Candidatus Binatia bacterium]|nr:M20/M25/M40 family metallo-hydrolase [Candidatus Binatia bacterium]